MGLEKLDAQLTAKEIRGNLDMILLENTWLLNQIDFNEVAGLANSIHAANRIFIIAAGRSGFAMRSTAMRLMHLGLSVYFVGETTTPAIADGDLLIAASGSGTTSNIVRAAQQAKAVGASVIAYTTAEESPLALLADQIVRIPAAGKQEVESSKSRQYAGSLFEQFLLLLNDALFQTLWKMDGSAATVLWERHANLE